MVKVGGRSGAAPFSCVFMRFDGGFGGEFEWLWFCKKIMDVEEDLFCLITKFRRVWMWASHFEKILKMTKMSKMSKMSKMNHLN